jgi:hypothetical protein
MAQGQENRANKETTEKATEIAYFPKSASRNKKHMYTITADPCLFACFFKAFAGNPGREGGPPSRVGSEVTTGCHHINLLTLVLS